MRRAFWILVVVAVVFLSGCGQEIPPTATPTLEPSPTFPVFTAEPPPPPTAAVIPDPTESTTVVLGGYFLRGGYWTWDDISNLLGYYATFGVYNTVALDGQTYTGVPLTYLLDYAEMEDGLLSVIVFSRSGEYYSYPLEDVTGCEDCLIARMPDDTLTLIMPDRNPPAIDQIVRIEAR